jgi:hypothetical protein
MNPATPTNSPRKRLGDFALDAVPLGRGGLKTVYAADNLAARSNSPRHDPRGPDEGLPRVYRGCCWWYLASAKFRAADRYGYLPGYRGHYFGLRLVRNASSVKALT